MRRSGLALVVVFAVAVAGCSARPAAVPSPARSWSGVSGPRPDLDAATPTTARASERAARMGEPARVGDWMIRVVGVDVDATGDVLAENQFNSPPPSGSRFTMVTLEASYVGSQLSSLWFVSDLRVVDDRGEHTTFDPSCGVIPGGFGFGEEVFAGGTIVGNVCWVLDDSNAGPFTMTARNPFVPGADVVIFVLDGDVPVADGTTTPDPLPPLDLPITRFGDAVDVGGWRVSVMDYEPDATETVMAENQFNDPPPDGQNFVIVRIRAERVSGTPGSLFSDTSVGLVGPSRVGRGPFSSSCGVIPDPLSDIAEVTQGTMIEGNVCWTMKVGDADGPVLFFTDLAGGERVYLAVSPS